MKRSIFVFALMMTAGSLPAVAQGGFQRRTVEERVKMVHDKLDSAFKLDAAKMAEVDSVFYNYYRASDKMRDEMMSGGGQPDFLAMREKMQPLTDERDAKLKPLLGVDNYKIWKEQIEPALRPRRPGGA
jgi:hypothetical protein